MSRRKKKNGQKMGGSSSKEGVQKRSSKSLDASSGKRDNRNGKHNKIREKSVSDSLHNDYEFRRTLQSNGSKTIKDMESDGNCLFRSLSDQLYNDNGNKHEHVRHEICNFLEANESDFAVFLLLDEDEEDVCNFQEYVSRMRNDGEWGGDVEVVCATRFYRRRITIYSASGAYNIEPDTDDLSGHDLLLSYHENSHYNSILDENIIKQYNGVKKESKPLNSRNKLKTVGLTDENVSTGKDDLIAQESDNNKGKRVIQQRNNLCSCGSGLRYKKCCLPKEKMKKRQEKFNEKYGLHKEIDETSENSSDDDVKMSECFRIMTI